MPVVFKAIAKQNALNVGLYHVVVMGCEVTGHPSFEEEENVVEIF